MAKKNIYVTNHPNGYGVRSEGASRPEKVFQTQKEAIDHGRKRAKAEKSELRIQRAKGPNKGQFRAADSYGNDPHPPKG